MAQDTQLKKGVLEGCVLKILDGEFRFSGEIVIRMRESGFIDFSEGTLYPMLMRLEKDGCFEVAKIASKNSTPKKYYRLSDIGKEMLSAFEKAWADTTASVAKIFGGKTDVE